MTLFQQKTSLDCPRQYCKNQPNVTERNKVLRAATQAAIQKTAAVRAAAKAKKAATAPHRVLRDIWYELMALHFPNQTTGVKWGAAELLLAKQAIAETDLESVLADVRHFIIDWCPRHNKFPSMRFFWAVRGQVHAEATGAVKRRKTGDERIKDGEFDREASAKEPKIGW